MGISIIEMYHDRKKIDVNVISIIKDTRYRQPNHLILPRQDHEFIYTTLVRALAEKIASGCNMGYLIKPPRANP